MFAVIIERNGQPIRAVTTPTARRAHRIARHWKHIIRETRMEQHATFTVAVTGGEGRAIVGVSRRGR